MARHFPAPVSVHGAKEDRRLLQGWLQPDWPFPKDADLSRIRTEPCRSSNKHAWIFQCQQVSLEGIPKMFGQHLAIFHDEKALLSFSRGNNEKPWGFAARYTDKHRSTMTAVMGRVSVIHSRKINNCELQGFLPLALHVVTKFPGHGTRFARKVESYHGLG